MNFGTDSAAPAPAARSSLLVWASAALLVAVCAGLYLPSLDNPLVWDDRVHIEDATGFWPVPGHEEYKRPLVTVSYRLQRAAGLGSAPYLHGANILMHGASVLLLFALLLRLGFAAGPSAAAALLFATHPLQSAAVAYVSGRTDLLAAVSTLGALHLVLSASRSAGRRRFLALTGGLVLSLAAAAAKEVGLAAPLLSLGLWWMCAGDKESGSLTVSSSYLITFGLAAGVALSVPVWQARGLDLAGSAASAGTALSTYARLLLLPGGLHMDRLSGLGGFASLLGGVAGAGAGLLLLVRFVRRPSPLLYAAMAAVVCYFPVSGLVPLYPAIADAWVYTPEQAMYLPLAALAPLAVLVPAEAGTRLADGRYGGAAKAAVALSVVVLAALAVGPARERQALFGNEEALYRNTLEHSPSPRACFNLGVVLLAGGRDQEALDVYQRCVRLAPNDAGMLVQLGVALQRNGQADRAGLAYASATRMAPATALAWSNWASLEASLGNFGGAREKWQRALSFEPGLGPALQGLAKLDHLAGGRD